MLLSCVYFVVVSGSRRGDALSGKRERFDQPREDFWAEENNHECRSQECNTALPAASTSCGCAQLGEPKYHTGERKGK